MMQVSRSPTSEWSQRGLVLGACGMGVYMKPSLVNSDFGFIVATITTCSFFPPRRFL